MCEPLPGGEARLYFGSAVVPRRTSRGDKPTLGFHFSGMLDFHKVYSRGS